MLVWGGTFTSAKILGNELDPTTSAFIRFFLASSILFALLIYKEKQFPRITKKQFLLLSGMGLTGIVSYNLLFFYGLIHAEASRGSMITASNPLLIAVGAAILFKERFNLINILGFFLCISGVILIISRGNFTELFQKGIGLGELAFIGCAFSWATYTLIGRFISQKLSSLAIITYASIFGTVILFFAALLQNDLIETIKSISLNASLNLLYLSILATVVGFVWFQDGVKVLGAAKAGVFIYFMPVSAVFWAYLILDEKITMVLFVGALLVISGIFLVNKKS